MYLSMWMILKGLKNYHPEPHITEGAMCIRNASLLYPGEPAGTHTVYLCPAEQYISGSGNKIICVTGNDYILIDCDDLEELFHQVTALIDFYLEWDLQARDRIQENCSLQELLELAEPVMNSLILVTGMDFSYEAIAGSRGYRHYDLLRDSLHPGGRLPDKYLRNYTDTFFSERANLQPFIYEERSLKEKLLVQSLIVEHQNVGSLVCIPNGTLNQPLFQLFSVLHSQIHLWKSQHMEFSRNTFAGYSRNMWDFVLQILF